MDKGDRLSFKERKQLVKYSDIISRFLLGIL